MKRYLLLLLFIASWGCVFSQGNKWAHPPVERRIEQKICIPGYKSMLDRIERDHLVTLGTEVNKDMATCRIGKVRGKEHVVVCTITYRVKEDRVVKVSRES